MICFQLALLEALGLRLCLPHLGGADDGSATALASSSSADKAALALAGVVPAPAPPQSCTLLAPPSASAAVSGPPIPPPRRPGQLLLPESPHFFTDQPVYASTIDDSSQHCAAVEDQDGSITALRGDLIISHSNATELHLPKLRVVTGCISIFDNVLLETISLPRLTAVGTDREHGDTSCLDIDNNPRLVRLRLPLLASVAQGIAVHDNAALVCSGQPSPQFPHAWRNLSHVPPHDTNCSIGAAALRSDTEQPRTLLLLLLPVLAGLLLLLLAALRTHDKNGDDYDGGLWLSPGKPPSSSQHGSPPHDEPGSPSEAAGQVHTDELEEEQEENAASDAKAVRKSLVRQLLAVVDDQVPFVNSPRLDGLMGTIPEDSSSEMSG